MARFWTCRKCRTRHPRIKQVCACGGRRPASKTASQKALSDPFEVWAEKFGDRCGICGDKQKPGGKRLHRDHQHGSGLARGVLCFRCNSALRNYMTAQWLRKAAYYLDCFEQRQKEAA